MISLANANPTVRIESGYLNPMAETQGASGCPTP